MRLCAPPADLRLTRATEPSERRWGAFKHGRDGRWDAAGMPASEAVADASLAGGGLQELVVETVTQESFRCLR